MPYQRALVSYQGQTETLVVESFMNEKKGDYAWLIPTPSKPTRIEACRPHMLSGLVESISPKIEISMMSYEPFAVPFAVMIFLLLFIYVTRYRKENRLMNLLASTLLLTVFYVCAGILSPVFAGPIAVKEKPIVKEGVAGSYAFSVLSSSQSTEVLDWLDKNGFTATDQARHAITDYVQAGWILTMFKYRHQSDGTNAPHPVSLTFDTKIPVYPMALTGSAAKRLRLDLVVLMQDRAQADGLRTISAQDTISFVHPDFLSRTAGTSVITHLRGDLTTPEMSRDLVIRSIPYTGPYRERWISRKDALGMILFDFGRFTPLAFVVLFIFTAIRPMSRRWWYRASFVVILLGLVASTGYHLLGSRLVNTETARNYYSIKLDSLSMWEKVTELENKKAIKPYDKSIISILGKDRQGDMPGYYELIKSGDNLKIRVYDRDYQASEATVTVKGNSFVLSDFRDVNLFPCQPSKTEPSSSQAPAAGSALQLPSCLLKPELTWSSAPDEKTAWKPLPKVVRTSP